MGFSENKIVDYHVALMYAPILAQLQANAKATLNDIAERIGLSKAPCQQRIQRIDKRRDYRLYSAAESP